jgi:hypothetical protein
MGKCRKSMVEPERQQVATWRRLARWISKATRVQAHFLVCTPTHAQTHTTTHTHNMKYLLIFHSNNGFVNASQCYVIHTLPVLFRSIYSKWPTIVHTSPAGNVT